jgi:hypothetical protein
MRRRPSGRLVVATVSGLVLVGLLTGTLLLVNGSLGFSECSGAVGCGLIIPILAGLVIGGVLWLLSAQTPKSDSHRVSGGGTRCTCCGDAVMAGWRLCPSCGGRLSGGDHLGESASERT